MANATDPTARHMHGADPQSLIDRIVRSRVYECAYWKEHCFGLNAATLIDQAVKLNHVGGVYGPHALPTPFLCLALKMLQIQPPVQAVEEYVVQAEYKYLRLLGAFYFRLVGRGVDVWRTLEGLLADYRKVRRRKEDGGWDVVHVDEVVDELLQSDKACSVTLPRLMRREQLEKMGKLQPRRSALMDLIEQEGQQEEEDREELKAAEAAAGGQSLLLPGEQEMKQQHTASAAAAAAANLLASIEMKQPAAAAETTVPAAPSAPLQAAAANGDVGEGSSQRDDRERKTSGEEQSRPLLRDERGRHEERRHERDRDDDDDRRRRRRRSSSFSRSPSRSPSPRRHRHRRRESEDRYDRRSSRRHREEGRSGDRHRRRRSPSYSRSRSRSPRRHRRRSSS